MCCGVLKLNATEVAISLPEIVPNISFSVTFKFCCISGSEFDANEGDNNNDCRSVLSKDQSQYYSMYVCFNGSFP